MERLVHPRLDAATADSRLQHEHGQQRGIENLNQTPNSPDDEESAGRVVRRRTTSAEALDANRRWWDGVADWYQAEHGSFLRDVGFVWSPEGTDEADVRLLGEVAGRRVLEVGCGAGQCGRWLVSRTAWVVGIDVSWRQLQHAQRIDASVGTRLPVIQADAEHLPFADGSFDLACSAYGAIPFVADSAAVMSEVARVLVPGGRWVFSVTHPVRWCFPDDPGPGGLLARRSYFDRRAYVERDEEDRITYSEHHSTAGDRVREIAAAGLRLVDLIEPEWPAGHDRVWGAWSPLRGRIIPGTAIFVCERP